MSRGTLMVKNAARDLSSAWQAFEQHVLIDCQGRCRAGLQSIVRQVKGERTRRLGGVKVRQRDASDDVLLPPPEPPGLVLWGGPGAAARVESIMPIIEAALAGQGCEEAVELAMDLQAADAAHSLAYEVQRERRGQREEVGDALAEVRTGMLDHPDDPEI